MRVQRGVPAYPETTTELVGIGAGWSLERGGLHLIVINLQAAFLR